MSKQRAAKAKRRLDKAVPRELERAGVYKRIEAVAAAMQDPGFRMKLNERLVALAGTEQDPKGLQEVRDVAFEVLRELGVDTTDVMLTMDWKPELGRKLLPEFHPTIEAQQRAEAAVARARGKAAA